MKLDHKVMFDGETYEPGEEIPDMGSLVCVSFNGKKRDYEGLQKDLDKLPSYVDTGSSCFMIDTGNYYKFEKTTGVWYEM